MKFCSQCGGTLKIEVPTNDDRPRHVCEACGTIHYRNPKLVVGTIPVWKNRILMCRRNIEPRKGCWTLPAGYLENGETTADGACRETFEETGSRVTDLRPYLMVDIIHINQIYLMFRANLEALDFKPTQESAEVRLFGENEILWDEIAFRVIGKTLRHYLQDLPAGRFEFHTGRIEIPGR